MRVEKTEDYAKWIDGLRDLTGRARVLMRVDRLLLLLAGGDKSSQVRDIAKAIRLNRSLGD